MESGRKFTAGSIVFSSSRPVFYSGQVVEGKLNLELNSSLEISAIDIVYLGEGNVKWTEEQFETYNGVKRRKLLEYVGREQYFNFVQRLAQGPTQLPAGTHSLAFSYQIPFTCPSSFKGEKGQVSYSVTAYIIHHDGITMEKIEADFNVIDPLNLNNSSPDIKNPLVMEFEETMGCQCFCGSAPLCVSVRMDAQGVCPGQTLPVVVSVRNTTSVELNKIIFQITSRERYCSQHPVSEYEPPEEVILSVKRGPILSNTVKDYMFDLKVPDFIAPNLDQCNIIDFGFFFKVKIKLSGCNEDMEEEAEICIGLVPLGESDVRNHPMVDELPIGPVPDPNNPVNIPPVYQTFTPKQSSQNSTQIGPPGPIPYPVVANVADKPIYGSKNSLVGPFEMGFRAPDVRANPTSPYPVPSYPYPGIPQAQTSPYPYPGAPQATNPPYPIQSNGSQPSAPPPY